MFSVLIGPFYICTIIHLGYGFCYVEYGYVYLAVAGGVFVLSFFPLDVLDEIWDLIDSVSEGFLTYSLYLVLDYRFFFKSFWSLLIQVIESNAL